MRVLAPIDKLHSWLTPSQNPKPGDEGNSSKKLVGKQFGFVISLKHTIIFKDDAYSVENLNTQKLRENAE